MAGRLLDVSTIDLLIDGDVKPLQIRIIALIIRESHGRNTDQLNWTHNPMTITEIAKRTGIHRSSAYRAVHGMIERNILHVDKRENGIHYLFNNDDITWRTK